MKTETTQQTLAQAFLSAQQEFDPVEKDKDNPHFRSRYASLDSIYSATKPALHKHGLTVYEEITLTDGRLEVVAVLELAATGERRTNSMAIAVGVSPGMQPLGSQITYMRRYTVGPLLGVVSSDDDDDGNAATPPPARHAMPKPAAKPTLTEAEEVYVADASAQIAACESEELLKEMAEQIRGKSEAVRNALRPLATARLGVLRTRPVEEVY